MEQITLSRTIWQYLLELSKHPDMGTSERIAAVAITENDFETNHFLNLRLKMQDGILRGLEDETLQALAETGEGTKEVVVTINLTAGEILFLEMCLEPTAWQGAVSTQHVLWKGLRSLVEHERQKKELGE